MEKRITATQAVRDFSEILNKIKFKGVHYIIERSGKAVAQMEPVNTPHKDRSLKELKFLLNKLPPLDDELAAFAEDLERIWKDRPPLPEEEGMWE